MAPMKGWQVLVKRDVAHSADGRRSLLECQWMKTVTWFVNGMNL